VDFAPSDVQRMLQDSAAAYVADRAGRASVHAWSAVDPGVDDAEWATLAKLGWLALQLPEEQGGIGGGPLEVMILMQALGQAAALQPFCSTAVIGARAVMRHGSAAQRRDLLPPLARGRLRVAFACDERGTGWPADSFATLALRSQDGYVLHGNMSCVLDASDADRLIVVARDAAGEIAPFLLDAKAPGIEYRHFARLDGGKASHLRLVGVRASADDRLGANAAGAAILADLTRLATAALCAEGLGAMQALHDLTLEYLKTRQQFGRPIGQFQALQHRLVDMLIALEETRSIVMAACMALAEELPEAERLLSMAKVTLGRAGRTVAQGAVQLHGGMGMTAELRIGVHFKRLTVIDALFGSADQRLRVLAGIHRNR